jgi:hypothetical protein
MWTKKYNYYLRKQKTSQLLLVSTRRMAASSLCPTADVILRNSFKRRQNHKIMPRLGRPRQTINDHVVVFALIPWYFSFGQKVMIITYSGNLH